LGNETKGFWVDFRKLANVVVCLGEQVLLSLIHLGVFISMALHQELEKKEV
jgi:hypothetical protein